jgi:hypothetical protein
MKQPDKTIRAKVFAIRPLELQAALSTSGSPQNGGWNWAYIKPGIGGRRRWWDVMIASADSIMP